jgi:hypothetical protein
LSDSISVLPFEFLAFHDCQNDECDRDEKGAQKQNINGSPVLHVVVSHSASFKFFLSLFNFRQIIA